MRHAAFALAAAAIVAAPGYADDSSAMLSAGGIVFTKTTPVRMVAEDLYVSPNAVRIRFEFQNPTSRDVETLVAFPLPDIATWDFAESAIGTVTDDSKNFIGFKAMIDGKPVAVTVEQRAFLKNKDVTAQLVAAGAVINPVTDGGYEKLAKLSKEKKKALIAAGLAEGDGADEFYPQWIVKTKFYWTQKFPHQKTVVIEHSYQPVTGQSFFTTAYHKRTDKKLFGDIDYCIDERTWATLAARTGGNGKPDEGTRLMNTYETGYILSTAANWQGPIGKFHLTLDKLKPDNILSLCWDGELKKTGPTTFEFSKDNYAPKRDINLVVMESAAPIP
jgi:hypothetical protein